MFGIGPMELVLILVVALLVFGPNRLPELARMLGRGLGEFRRASNDLRQSLALDDLQKDLRDGLNGGNTIHRPQSLDRPAQAGDDVPPHAAPTAGADAPSPASSGSESGAAAPHPGELPLGNDHEHHDVAPLEDEAGASAAAPADAASTDAPAKLAAQDEGAPESDAGANAGAGRAAGGSPSAVDSELGNVPVDRGAGTGRKRG